MIVKFAEGHESVCKATDDLRHDDKAFPPGWIVRYDCGERGKMTYRFVRGTNHPQTRRFGAYLMIAVAPSVWTEMSSAVSGRSEKWRTSIDSRSLDGAAILLPLRAAPLGS